MSWETAVSYFRRILMLWTGRILVIIDLVGFGFLAISLLIPGFTLPHWSLWGLLMVTIGGLLIANLQLFAEQQTQISKLHKRLEMTESAFIAQDSLVICAHPRPGSRKALVKYIRGGESIRDVEATVCFTGSDGKAKEQHIDTFYDTNHVPDRDVGNYLEPSGELSFYLPFSEETLDNQVTVRIWAVGAQSGRSAQIEKQLALNPDAGRLLW